MKYDFYTIEPANRSYAHDQNAVVVYGWGVYPQSSVLAGQQCKKYIDEFASLESALKEYPEADITDHSLSAGNTFNHLPDTEMNAYEEENYFNGDDE
tara:strand:- start:231 stop:521 length:291 start_codon:yes stop_codon:yes gene_type:complete